MELNNWSSRRISYRDQKITYASSGVNRNLRKKTHTRISSLISNRWLDYAFGKPVLLPFGAIFPTSRSRESFYDFEIEGIGSKTLLAEMDPEGSASVGLDGVAMAVNDVIRSGASPLLLADAIHTAESNPSQIAEIVKGVQRGAEMSRCVLCSGETGDVAEVLHEPLPDSYSKPFDLMVSCLGIVGKNEMIKGQISAGDVIIGLESSGIHSNGITLARRILLRPWGGRYGPDDIPDGFERSIVKELLEPTRIYVDEVMAGLRNFGLKAAIHITGDGFAKFRRLLAHQEKSKDLGIDFDAVGPVRGIFKLLQDTAKMTRGLVTKREMYRTFNMGFGFAVVTGRRGSEGLLDLFNKYHPARRIGRVTNSGKIVILGDSRWEKPVIL